MSYYHFPQEVTSKARKEIDVNCSPLVSFGSAEFSQINLEGIVEDSPLSPVLFVIDFDNTLAVYDELYILDNWTTNKFPSTYTRPFLYEFLDFIKTINTNNVVIMWTAGKDNYIKQNLLLLNITQYFHEILSRKHCEESLKLFGKIKSHQFLVSLFPQFKRMRSILIDNYAYENGYETGYSTLVSVKPFTLRDVVETYGAFGKHADVIRNTEIFLCSRGKLGLKRKRNELVLRLGDTTLLNLIRYLQERLFNIYKTYNNINNNNDIEDIALVTHDLKLKNNYISLAKIEI